MTQSLQELLEQVRSAEAEPAEWAGLQTRVLSALCDGNPAVTSRDNEAAPASAAVRPTVVTRGGGPTAWLGGGIAVGAVVAGLMLASRAGSELTESERSADNGRVLAPHPIVLDAVIPDLGAGAWSTRATSRKARSAPHAHGEVADTASLPQAELNVGASEVRELGESDVEYDRRHLAPIDAALHAHRPDQALRLSNAFTPRKLTHYARALKAIALCEVGQTVEGQHLAQQTLPQVTNQGLARRVQNACKPSPANEPE